MSSRSRSSSRRRREWSGGRGSRPKGEGGQLQGSASLSFRGAAAVDAGAGVPEGDELLPTDQQSIDVYKYVRVRIHARADLREDLSKRGKDSRWSRSDATTPIAATTLSNCSYLYRCTGARTAVPKTRSVPCTFTQRRAADLSPSSFDTVTGPGDPGPGCVQSFRCQLQLAMTRI